MHEFVAIVQGPDGVILARELTVPGFRYAYTAAKARLPSEDSLLGVIRADLLSACLATAMQGASEEAPEATEPDFVDQMLEEMGDKITSY